MAEQPLEHEGQLNYRYNSMFFHPTICHVCKWMNSGNTIPCDCGMIFYCDQQHMMLDQEQSEGIVGHGEICKAIRKLTSEGKMRNYNPIDHGEWYYRPYTYTKIVKKELKRNLHPHERHMLLYARSCIFCHCETGLQRCTSCYCVDRCEVHELTKHHKYHKCEDRRKWLDISMLTINLGTPPSRTFHDFPERCHVQNMNEFYEAYVLHMKEMPWHILDIVYSDYFSWPLTTYYALRTANLFQVPEPDKETSVTTYIIHILEAKNADKYLPFWEIFLHVFSKPTKLIVVMIGAQIAPELAGTSGTVPICREKCTVLGHELHYEYHRMLYHDYASKEKKLFKRPNVIVGFHVKLSGGETWKKFTSSLENPTFPLILTTRTRVNGRRHLVRIKKALSEGVRPFLNRPNNFASSNMSRDVERDRVYYHNQHLLLYKHLCHMELPVKESIKLSVKQPVKRRIKKRKKQAKQQPVE